MSDIHDLMQEHNIVNVTTSDQSHRADGKKSYDVTYTKSTCSECGNIHNENITVRAKDSESAVKIVAKRLERLTA